jgi:ribosomal-protein-alanine N-acetyltransferase
VIARRASVDDIPELLRIEDECFGKERFSVEVVRAFILRVDAFTVVACDEQTGKLVGSASCLISEDAGEGRIASIAVVKDREEQGIGSSLLNECEHVLLGFRLKKFVLEVETTNTPAIHLYTNRGYKTVGLLKDYYGGGRDAYAMEKMLDRTTRKLIVR